MYKFNKISQNNCYGQSWRHCKKGGKLFENRFYFGDCLSLAKYLHSIYPSLHSVLLPYSVESGNNRVKITNKLIEEMSDEIYMMGGNGIVDDNQRIVIHDSIFIQIYMKKYDLYYYCLYTPELYLAFTDKEITRFEHCGGNNTLYISLKLPEWKEFNKRTSFYRFVWDYTKSRMNIEGYIVKCRNKSSSVLTIPGEMTVDHADNNHRNSCLYNLSLMTKGENSAKGTLLAQIRWPYYALIVVEPNGTYRVLYGSVETRAHKGFVKLFHCRKPSNLIYLLDKLVKESKTLVEDINCYMSEDIYLSYRLANKVIRIPDELFEEVHGEWNPKTYSSKNRK